MATPRCGPPVAAVGDRRVRLRLRRPPAATARPREAEPVALGARATEAGPSPAADSLEASPPPAKEDEASKGGGHGQVIGQRGRSAPPNLPFGEARALARDARLRTRAEYLSWEGRPEGLPQRPDSAYKGKGWTCWTDFLGTAMLPFEEARALVREAELLGKQDYERWDRPRGVPSNPDKTYRDRWVSWGDWLGYGDGQPAVERGRAASTRWASFEEARDLARELKCRSRDEWREWARGRRRPAHIPSNPDVVYKADWGGWPDFLGFQSSTQRAARPAAPTQAPFRDFEECRNFAWSLSLRSQREWERWAESDARPSDVPSRPDSVYREDGWLSWADWLGYGKGQLPRGIMLSFEEAREQVRALRLNGLEEWERWSRSSARPANIPSHPHQRYADSWVSWDDFIGRDPVGAAPRFVSFAEARRVARSLGLSSTREWFAWCNSADRPPNVPTHPHQFYAFKGWTDWDDWLGLAQGQAAETERKRSKEAEKSVRPVPFREARELARNLELASIEQWFAWAESDERPPNIPTHPHQYYAFDGWESWTDFLVGDRVSMPTRVMQFSEARAYARGLGLSSAQEWFEWCATGDRPAELPTHPNRRYAVDGWRSWSDWLGVDDC